LVAGGGYLPAINVGVQVTEDGDVTVIEAEVDTGATMCVISGAVAVDAGLDPAASYLRVVPISGIGGRTGMHPYVHGVTLYVGSPLAFRTIATEVAFTEPGIELPLNVIGWHGFLDHVRFAIDGATRPPTLYVGVVDQRSPATPQRDP
jgi:hypothetical protein